MRRQRRQAAIEGTSCQDKAPCTSSRTIQAPHLRGLFPREGRSMQLLRLDELAPHLLPVAPIERFRSQQPRGQCRYPRSLMVCLACQRRHSSNRCHTGRPKYRNRDRTKQLIHKCKRRSFYGPSQRRIGGHTRYWRHSSDRTR